VFSFPGGGSAGPLFPFSQKHERLPLQDQAESEPFPTLDGRNVVAVRLLDSEKPVVAADVVVGPDDGHRGQRGIVQRDLNSILAGEREERRKVPAGRLL